MKTAGKRFLVLIGFAVNLFYTSCTQAQYGQQGYGQPYPPSYGQGYGQPGYDEPYDGDFYNDLSPYGQWVQTPEYGTVWIPNVEPGFQPYASNGHWVITEYGNTWVSDYSWGWAPFHYGRWYLDRYRGWAWVPGREWGPAWVAWRSGGGYYGWAPLGPGVNINVNINIPANNWVFVPQTYITSPRLYSYCVPRPQVVNVYRNTTIINNVYRVNNRSYYYGPRRDEIERVTRRSVPVYRIENPGRPGRDQIRDNSVGIYRPDPRRNGNNRRNDNGTYGGNSYPNSRGTNTYSQPGDRGTYSRPDNQQNQTPSYEPRPNRPRGSAGDVTPRETQPQRDPSYPGYGNQRQRYERPATPMEQPAPTPQAQPQPNPQPQERLERVPTPQRDWGGSRGGGSYSRPDNSQAQPGFNQPNASQPQQEQRTNRFERRMQEAERNLGQPPAQTPQGNQPAGRGSRGPR